MKELDISTPKEVLQDPHFYHSLGIGASTALITRYYAPESNRSFLYGGVATAIAYWYMVTWGHGLPPTTNN